MKTLRIVVLLSLFALLIGCSGMNNPLSSESEDEKAPRDHNSLYSGGHNNG